MKNRSRIAVAAMVLGTAFGWSQAHAQGFNRRYDLIGQGEYQVAFDIERHPLGYIILGVSPIVLQNNDYYNPTSVSMVLNEAGDILYSDSIIVPDHYLSPGAWNAGRRRSGGGGVSGGSTIVEDGTTRFALLKIRESGRLDFVAEYGSPGEEWIGRQAIECKDGGFLMVGESGEFGLIDGMLIKTDSSGVVEWQRNYGGPMRDYFFASDTTANEDLFVAGGLRFVEENIDWWAMRLTSVGDTVWAVTWGSGFPDLIPGITTKHNGNMLFAFGWNYAQDAPVSRVYMAELDQNNGDILWEREYGPMLNFTILRVAKEVAQGEGHIATGFAFAENSNFWQGIMLRTADNGDSLWMRRYFYYDDLMTDGMGELNDVVPTLDGGFIACGFTQGAYTGPYPPSYSQDVWVVKVDSLGCIIPGCDIPMGITSQITNLGYALNVYPNPLRRAQGVNHLHVAVKLPANFKTEGPLVLTVVSMEGKSVRQEVVPTSAPNELLIDVTGLAPGAYTVHLSDAHTWIAGKKFVIE